MAKVVTVRDNGRKRVQTVNEEPSLTVQSDRNNAEMKHIVTKYEATGVLVGLRDVDLEFRDVSEFTDFSEMMRQTKDAEAAFMRLPSKLREVFHHDVMEWLDAAHDPEKIEALRPQLEELGVLEPVTGSERDPEPEPDPEPSGGSESE